jgi:hypothetical protein
MRGEVLLLCCLLLLCVIPTGSLHVEPFIVLTQARSMSTLLGSMLTNRKVCISKPSQQRRVTLVVQIGFVYLYEFAKKSPQKGRNAPKLLAEHNLTTPVDLAMRVANFYFDLERIRGERDVAEAMGNQFAHIKAEDTVKVGFKLRLDDIPGRYPESKLVVFMKALSDFSKHKLKIIFLHRNAVSRTFSELEASATRVFHAERLSPQERKRYILRKVPVKAKQFVRMYSLQCRNNKSTLQQLQRLVSEHPHAAEYLDVPSESIGNVTERPKAMREIFSFLLQGDDNPTKQWRNMSFQVLYSKFLPNIISPGTVTGRGSFPLSFRIDHYENVLNDLLAFVIEDEASGKYFTSELSGCREKLLTFVKRELGNIHRVTF